MKIYNGEDILLNNIRNVIGFNINELSFLDSDKLYAALLKYNQSSDNKINFIYINEYNYSQQVLEDLKDKHAIFYIVFTANCFINNKFYEFKVHFAFNRDNEFIGFGNEPNDNIFNIKSEDIAEIDKKLTYHWKSDVSINESFEKIINIISNYSKLHNIICFE